MGGHPRQAGGYIDSDWWYHAGMGATRGIHIIWTTYGTWLPGDPRGHWSSLFDLYGRLKQAGHQLNLPDADTYSRARCLMKESPKTLSIDEMRIVAEVLGSYIAPDLSGVGGDDRPLCHACAIESTHAHLLVGPVHQPIGKFVGRLKGTSSSAILRLSNNAGRNRVWTAGYWKVFLFDDEAVHAVAHYIEAHNTRRERPEAPYPRITPI